MHKSNVFKYLILLPIVAGLLVACGKSDRQIVEERAQAYWNAVVAGDYVTAYAYERLSVDEPAGLQRYMAGKGAIRYNSAEVTAVQVDRARGEAAVTVRSTYILPAMLKMKPVTEDLPTRWVKVGNEWFNEPVRKP